jgi:hypothetical protein
LMRSLRKKKKNLWKYKTNPFSKEGVLLDGGIYDNRENK